MDKRQTTVTKEEYCCAICQFGSKAADSDLILCVKKGVLQPDYKCKAFKYDPLKRVPKRTPELPEYTFEDFKL